LAVPRPREGVCGGAKFLAPPYYSQRAVFASSLSVFSFISEPAGGAVRSTVVEILPQLLVIHFTRFAVLFKVGAIFSMMFKSGDYAGQESDFFHF